MGSDDRCGGSGVCHDRSRCIQPAFRYFCHPSRWNYLKEIRKMFVKMKNFIINTFEVCKKFLHDYQINVLALIIIFVISSLVGVAVAYKGYRYVIYDANFCDKCHAHDYANDAWNDSPHYKSTTCHDCHHQSVYANARGFFLTVFANHYKSDKKIHDIPKVEDKHCTKCHLPAKKGTWLDVVGPLSGYDIGKIIKIKDTLGHRIHLLAKTRDPDHSAPWSGNAQGHSKNREMIDENSPEAEKAFDVEEEHRVINCRDCHGSKQNRAHSFSAIPENCVECHKSISKGTKVVGHLKQNCMLCHFANFLTVERLDPYKE